MAKHPRKRGMMRSEQKLESLKHLYARKATKIKIKIDFKARILTFMGDVTKWGGERKREDKRLMTKRR